MMELEEVERSLRESEQLNPTRMGRKFSGCVGIIRNGKMEGVRVR
jgi:hypothetical protein